MIRFAERASARVVAELDEGLRELEFSLDEPFEQFLEHAGRLPLPPCRPSSPARPKGIPADCEPQARHGR